MNSRSLVKVINIIPLLFSGAVLAHHGNASHFDTNKKVDIEGKVTNFAFTNPHVYIYFTVDDVHGEPQEWRCETTSATALKRSGWDKETIQKGQSIKILGTPARREDHLCYVNQLFVNGVDYAFDKAPPIQAPPLDNHLVVSQNEPDVATKRALLHENGQPNISGYWYNPYFGRNRPTPYLPNGGYTRTAAGQSATDNFDDTSQSPALFCKPHNIIRAWGHDAHVNQITQSIDKITLQHGYMDFQRIIHLSLSQHPADITPSTAGHSIGWWEDDTLVVDTIGFSPGSIFPRDDVMHSEQMHTVERFWVNPQSQELERSYRVEDPLFLAEVLHDIDYQKASATPYEAYGCEHHNN